MPLRFADALRRAGVGGRPRTWWTAWRLAVGAALLAGALFAGPGAALLAAALAVGAPVVGLHLARGRETSAIERALPTLLEECARRVRAGDSLDRALVAAGRGTAGQRAPALAADLAQLEAALGRGDDLADALPRWEATRPLAGVHLAVAALRLSTRQGGAQARAVDGVVLTLRARLDESAELRAATAQARASVAVLGAAPVVFALVAFALDPATARSALSSGVGVASLAAGLLLDVAAVAWMQRLTASLP